MGLETILCNLFYLGEASNFLCHSFVVLHFIELYTLPSLSAVSVQYSRRVFSLLNMVKYDKQHFNKVSISRQGFGHVTSNQNHD